MRTSSPFTEVACPSCGRTRRVSARQARRGSICRLCLYPDTEPKVTPADMRFWLNRFTDHELAVLASDMIGEMVKPEGIGRARQVLLASAAPDDE